MDFIPSLPVFLAFSLALLLLAITPGPDMTLWISRSLRDGRVIGLMTLAGTSFGISIHTLLVAFGICSGLRCRPSGTARTSSSRRMVMRWFRRRVRS
jgi:threonine/homoserine/homoserine lactone efflux protein